jgi:hypothetical protein
MLSREQVVVGELVFLISLTAEGGMGVAYAMQLAAVDGVIVNGGGGIMEAFVLLRIVLEISCDDAPSLSIFFCALRFPSHCATAIVIVLFKLICPCRTVFVKNFYVVENTQHRAERFPMRSRKSKDRAYDSF